MEHEFKGMDLVHHGESAYPADAWVEQQYMDAEEVTLLFLLSSLTYMYMSQMLYAGQSARPSVTFLSDF